MSRSEGRREWFRSGLLCVAAPLVSAAAAEKEEDVSPAEDLMREHGVLKRVLLIYRHVAERIEAKREFPSDVIVSSAQLIHDFVESYHEKLEEDYLFPRFRKANRLTDLVATLETQHQRGRAVTERTLQLAKAGARDDAAKTELRRRLLDFVHMYEPHEAREDTVLFPAFRKLVSKHEYDALGEEFEKKENQLFGGDGFEKNVAAVAALEKKVGIYDLAQFTPKL
jgi:hemerythrin-like domain-containing protein